ncbi:MAG: hypothetical protein AAF357_04005 [Verrucomicrobiota bacterium]
MSEHFIPVAIKAALVQRPPTGPAGVFYEELRRTQPATQGMAVMNSSGNVLAWSLMFQNDASVIRFLEHSIQRFQEHPDTTSQPIAERFHQYPDRKLPDLPASQAIAGLSLSEDESYSVPREFRSAAGALPGRLVGRALDSEGEPLRIGVRSQETYVEDRFEISPKSLESFIAAIHSSKVREVIPIPALFARELVASAYLGMLDVAPLGGKAIGGEILEEKIQLRARRLEPSDGVQAIQIWGDSRCEGKASPFDQNRKARDWHNRVHLNWTGQATLRGRELIELVAIGKGEEMLHWNHGAASAPSDREAPQTNVANLPAGRPIRYSGPVCFGISVSIPGTFQRDSE